MTTMVTFAQAQERAEEWINGEVPGYQQREVRVREFELGFVVWAEDREGGPVSDGGRQRLVIARDSGDASLWPALPVGEVIRRYEEAYGAPQDAVPAPEAPQRIDLNQTSFLLTPPEWLQEAADRLGIPDRREAPSSSPSPEDAPTDLVRGYGAGAPGNGSLGGNESLGGGSLGGGAPLAASGGYAPTDVLPSVPSGSPGSTPWAGTDTNAAGPGGSVRPGPQPPVPPGATPWTGTDTNAANDGSVPLPPTVFAPPLSGADDEDTPPPGLAADAPTALMSSGSGLPRTTIAPAVEGAGGHAGVGGSSDGPGVGHAGLGAGPAGSGAGPHGPGHASGVGHGAPGGPGVGHGAQGGPGAGHDAGSGAPGHAPGVGHAGVGGSGAGHEGPGAGASAPGTGPAGAGTGPGAGHGSGAGPVGPG
ncbi:hypothetical protein GT042_33975, partial [Streptomyces sp. SID3212]|nr:hypothetical protein [Streptomyces sp. SID3212]